MALEVQLTGGTLTTVTRIGDTVHRPCARGSDGVHLLLQHLEREGFAGAPRFLGFDADKREILSFLEGTVANWPWPQVLCEDSGLQQIGTWLKTFHESSARFHPPQDLIWNDETKLDKPGQIILQGDPGPWNMIWKEGKLVGFIDFDFAHPGNPIDEVLETIWHIAPLYIDEFRQQAGVAHIDRLHRANNLLEAYGTNLRFENEKKLAQAVLDFATRQRQACAERAKLGIEPWVTLVGRWAENDKKWIWLKDKAL